MTLERAKLVNSIGGRKKMQMQMQMQMQMVCVWTQGAWKINGYIKFSSACGNVWKARSAKLIPFTACPFCGREMVIANGITNYVYNAAKEEAMAALAVELKIVGVGGKRRLCFVAFVARLLGIKLDVKGEEHGF